MNAVPISLRLGFAGTPQFAVDALDALLLSRHTVAAVFTQPDRPAGRGRSMQMSMVKRRAEALGIEVHQPSSFKTPSATDTLRGLNLDALVVVAYGLILPPAALAAPRRGCFNIHASLLPRWRGAAPIQRALLAGDANTGISIMRMDAGLDSGPLLAVRSLSIGLNETAGSLHDRLAKLGGELLVDTLNAVADGRSREQAQPSVGITLAAKIDKAEAMIDWQKNAVRILREVRAFNPWPIAETRLLGTQLRIWEAAPAPVSSGALAPGSVIAATGEGIDVACGQGALRILRLQLAGRKSLTAQDFIKSVKLAGATLANS